MASSLIGRIKHIISQAEDPELKIGLRTLQALLSLRKSEIEAELRNHRLSSLPNSWSGYEDAKWKPSSLLSLFFRIRRLVHVTEVGAEMVSEVNSLCKEVDDEVWNRMTHSSLLTNREIVEIALLVMDSAEDISDLLPRSPDVVKAIDALDLHTRNTLGFILFAMRTGAELENWRFHVKPIAINAARVFIKDDASMWGEDVMSKCLAVNRMASDPQLYQACSHALASSTLLVDHHDTIQWFLDSLVSILWDKLCQSHSKSRYQHHFKMLYERIRSTRSIARNYKDEKTMGQIGGLIREAGVFIYSYCSHHQTDFGLLPDLLQRFDVFLAQVKPETMSIKANEELVFGDICDDVDGKGFDNPTPIWGQPAQSSTTPPVVGFHSEEITPILDRLTRGPKQLRIVPISGMAGIGKTTFALQLFNHLNVMYYFSRRAWCRVSQAFDVKIVLGKLLDQILESPGSYYEMSVEDLADKLRKSLKGRRYLIVLDDVWTPEVWDTLRASFPNDTNGSRIIMTSRRVDIASCDLCAEKSHSLRLREDNESLKILEKKLIHKEGWNLDVGEKIAKLCKGLPLTLGIVAGVLAKTEQEGWNGILDQLGLGGLEFLTESAIELSYEQLPDYLRPCLLYFGVFSEDDDIFVKRVIQLWMAEGFVGGNDKSMEEVGREYLKNLVERSLVMVVEDRSIGGVKRCRVHDLIHEFCRKKAKKEGFFHVLLQRFDELSNFNEPCNLQRLSIRSTADHFTQSKIFCPGARSILFYGRLSRLYDLSSITQVCEHLSVLDISGFVVGNGIPNEIDRLTQLRFFLISIEVPVIPSSVGNLQHLETFIVIFFSLGARGSFPQTLWNLPKLKYLEFYSDWKGFILPTENLENSSILLELEALRTAAFYCDDSCTEKQMRKFPNLRKLQCIILPSVQSTEASHKLVVPEFPSKLETLTIYGSYEVEYVFGSFPASLRKLKMAEFELSKEDIEVIGKIPTLEVLKLSSIHFQQNMLDMEEAGFPKLRILELNDSNGQLERWAATDDQLSCLVKLVFRNCLTLEEIPSCLETSLTLEEIQVRECSSTLEGLVRDVKEVQSDYGNSIEIRIIPLNPEVQSRKRHSAKRKAEPGEDDITIDPESLQYGLSEIETFCPKTKSAKVDLEVSTRENYQMGKQ